MVRAFVRPNDLASLLAAHRPSRQLVKLNRLTGGSKKGVYRLTLDDDSTSILYVWNTDENYWPASDDPVDDPFTDANGANLFQASHAALEAVGARVPQVYGFDRTGQHFPADLALIEDVRGESLEALIERDPEAAAKPLAQLGSSLRAMHHHHGPSVGKVALITPGDSSPQGRPEDVIVARALRHLDAIAAREARIANVRDEVEALVRVKRAAVPPRHEYSLVHGELGPDHVLLDDSGSPVLIDIEGLTYFDVEWEHAFLRLRFRPADYARLGLPDVDEARVELYRFAQVLQLIEGPLRIADTDFPDRDWMRQLAEWNIQKTLSAVTGT